MRGWGSEPPFPGLPDPVARVLSDGGGRDRPSSCTPSCPRPQLAGSGCRAAFISVPGSSTFLEPAAPFSLPKQRPLCRGHRAGPLGSFLQAHEPNRPHSAPPRGLGRLCQGPPPRSFVPQTWGRCFKLPAARLTHSLDGDEVLTVQITIWATCFCLPV